MNASRMDWQKVYAVIEFQVATISGHERRKWTRMLRLPALHFTIALRASIVLTTRTKTMEVTKALAALQPLYGKGNIEIVKKLQGQNNPVSI